jgi:hypothetical protein
MAPPTAAQLQLIRRFEPILFFDPAERFFPSDAKRYLEHCALWKARAPFLTMEDWQNPAPAAARQPAIAAGEIGAIDGQASVYLGRTTTPTGNFEFLETPPNQECFFDLGGWKPAGTLPADRYADLDRIAERYRTEPGLNESQFWYHAEFFDTSRLRGLFDVVRSTGGHDFRSLFRLFGVATASLNIPSLICYYLFFPGHDEGLPGCEGAAEAREFASFAGEWECIALLLDQATDGTYSAKFIGLTGPNIGEVLHGGGEVRVGMRIFSWDTTADQQRFDDHPRLAIAKGSHALYIPGAADRQEPVTPFTTADPSRNSCGRAEAPAASFPFQETEFPGAGEAIGILLGKTLGLAFASGGLGFIPGAIWGLIELGDAGDTTTVNVPIPPPPGLGAPIDNVTTAGEVIHPKGKVPAGVPLTRAHPWRSENLTLPNGRSYDFTVDRATQILWPGDPFYKGYTGRWGPRVEADQQTRRAGMRFPNFWRMFFDELVRSDPPKPLPPPVLIPRTEGIAIGNAYSRGGLAAAYDGVTNQIWSNSPVGNAPSLYNGKRFATTYHISGIKIWVSSDRGFNNNTDAGNPDAASGKCTVYGKSGADPATPIDGAVLREFTIQDLANPDPANPSVAIMDGFNASVAYDRVWVVIDNPARADLAVFTEIEWYRSA